MAIDLIISENLKKLRSERNLSLGQLSELCGVSKVMLSQIEKGSSNPTINTILKITSSLNVPYTALLEKQEQGAQVIKKADTSVQISDNGNAQTFWYYTTNAYRNFELLQSEIKEGTSYVSLGNPLRSQEYVMVIEGELTLEIGDESFILSKDDCIMFDATKEHTIKNSGKGTLKTVTINYHQV